MEVIDTLDFQFRLYGVILSVACYVYFLFKAPAANFFSGLTAICLGPQPIFGGLFYGRLVVILQSVAVLLLLIKVVPKRWERMPKYPSHYLILLGILWAKVAFDCALGGMGEFRAEALKAGLYTVVLPSLILFLATMYGGPDKAVRDLLWGLCAFAAASILPVVYPMIVEGRLHGALAGETRLIVYGLDYINGGKMFFLGALGFLLLGSTALGQFKRRWLMLSISLVFFVLILLNGTRQYIVGMIAAFLGCLIIQGKRRQFAAWIGMLLLTAVSYKIIGLLATAQFGERFTSESFAMEVFEGRGAIWADALRTGISYPLSGVGFRNYGEEGVNFSAETGELIKFRDNAHGFFQEICAEHGLLLACLLLFTWLFSFGKFVFYRRTGSSENYQEMAFLLSICFCLVDSFSASIYNSMGFYLFGFCSWAFGPAYNPAPEQAKHISIRPKPLSSVSAVGARRL